MQVLLIFALRTVHRIMCAKVKKNLLFLLLQKFIEYLESRYMMKLNKEIDMVS